VKDTSALDAIGLQPGDRVRFRRKEGGRWQEASVVNREKDGSIGVRDQKGASRALPMERLEVKALGPRGARTWEPVTERAARTEQLEIKW
jgi:hypothetical protein